MMGKATEQIGSVCAGNTVGLVGVDQFLIKTGTISNVETCYPIRMMKLSVSPVVTIAVSVKNQSDLSKLVESLNKLKKTDPLALIEHSEAGEHTISGSGELHVEIL